MGYFQGRLLPGSPPKITSLRKCTRTRFYSKWFSQNITGSHELRKLPRNVEQQQNHPATGCFCHRHLTISGGGGGGYAISREKGRKEMYQLLVTSLVQQKTLFWSHWRPREQGHGLPPLRLNKQQTSRAQTMESDCCKPHIFLVRLLAVDIINQQ